MMERWPLWPTLVLICLLTLWRDGQAESAFIIDKVKLSILPGATVERGTNLTLRCEAKVSHNAPQLVQTFRFLLSEKVIYSKTSSDAVAEYSLGPARASNTGLYKCQVHIEKRSKDSDILTLNVTGMQTPQLKVQPKVVNEGDDVVATCSAPEETGNLIFKFYKDNQYLPARDTKNNSATIVLKAQELRNMELHCNYMLVILPTIQQSKNSAPVKILVKELDIRPLIRISPTAVVEGDRVYISCNVSGYRHGDLEVFLTKTTLLNKHHTSFTHSFQAKANDSGEYVCKSEKGSVQKISTAHLEVTELFSRPLLKLSPDQVFEGQFFNLSCWSASVSQSRITTAGIKFSLYKDKNLLKQGNTFSTLASKADNGNYTCVAEDRGIQKTSKTLTVHFKVPVSVPVIRAVGQVIIGQPFQLLCESDHGTLPITYTLLKSDRPMAHMTISEPLHSAVFDVSSITYKNESRSFSCQAQNQGSHYSKASLVLDTQVIETVSKPELTLDLKGNMATEDKDLILYCSVQQGTVPITFTWYREGHAAPLFSTHISKRRGSHTIKSITRDHKGSYYCKATNDANETRASLPVDIRVNLAAWKKIAIGVSCIVLFVFIVMILLVFLKKAHAPRKRKRAVELSVKSKSNDPMRMSLTLDIEDNTAINATPCIMGRNVWGEYVSSSEFDEQSVEEDSENVKNDNVPTPECVDAVGRQAVQPQEELPVPVMEDGGNVKNEVCTEAPVIEDTGHVKNEICTEGSADQMNQPDLEYVQLSHGEQETA